MEEEEQEFRPLTPVTVQVRQETPPPVVNRPQPVRVEASARLPNPMPTFSIPAPTNQGPRAFFRSSGIFQPSSGTYVPFPELLTPVSPPLQQSGSYVPPPTTPVLVTPATVLYTSAAQVPPYDTRVQPTETEFVAIQNPETSTSTYVPSNQNLNTAFLGETGIPPFTAPESFRAYIPSTNTVASLKRQLNKLEAENNRLRKENAEKYAELEKATKNTYRQTEERILQLERYIKEGGYSGTQTHPRSTRPDDGQDFNPLPSTSRGALSSSHRTFSDDERLTGARSSSQQYPPRFQARSNLERQIPIRAFNQSVPILLPPRLPPPPGTPHSGHGPPADGNRCIGCGISGHNTYNCPYQNIPFCYGCKRFGHIRSQCRPEWVADLPGDAVMPNPPEIPQWVLNPGQRPAIQQGPSVEPKPENGNVVRLSSFSKGPASPDTFILDTGASYHVVNNTNILSYFVPQHHSRVFYTAEGKSMFTVIGTGVLTIQCKTRNHSICLTLREVLVAPAIPVNVLSVAKLCEQNLVTVVFTDKYASFCRCEEIASPSLSSPSSYNQTSKSTCVTPDKQSVVVEDFHQLTPPRECRATYYSSPFFSVPRNSENLYSFVLSVSKCNNIPLSYSSIHFFEESIPEGMCQASLLVLLANETALQSTTASEYLGGQVEGDNQITEQTQNSSVQKYRNKSGGHKDCSANKPIAPPPDRSPKGIVTLWHQRLAHASLPVVKQFLSKLQPVGI